MDAKKLKFDECMFETALRRKLNDDTVKVLKIACNCFSEKGLNFLGELFDVTVRYTVSSENEKTKSERTINMVAKLEPADTIPRGIVHQQDMFATELKVLRDILPRMTKIIGSQLGPDLFYGCNNPPVLLMENLKDRGFILKERQIGFSMEHCSLTMKQLAKFHAGSVAMFQKNPDLIESFRDSGILSCKCPKTYIRLIEVSLMRIGNVAKKWSNGKYTRAADKLIRLSEIIGSLCTDVYNCDPGEFAVLNHGDCWINNMMFKENKEGKPTDLLLVDYQMSVYSSPAIDLLYFLNTCPELSVKYDNDDYLLSVYLNTLEETMRKIGCEIKPPTMQELKNAMYKRRTYAVFSGIVLHLRMMANKEDTEDFSEVLAHLAGETKMDVFRNPNAVRMAKKMLLIMDERGYLD